MVDDSAWISFVQSANRAELDEIFRYQTNYKLLVMATAMATTCAIRGYALWIKSEIMALRLLIGKRSFRLAQALVIIVHYAVLAITALFWALLWAKSIPCQAVLWSIWTIYVAVWAMSNGIFLLRIHALYNRRRKVMRFFFVVYFFGLLLWSTAVPNFRAKVAPPHLQAHHLPHCRLERLPYEAAYAWTLSFFFDFSVVVAIWLAYRGNEVFAPFPPDHHFAHLNYNEENQHEEDGVVVSHRGSSRERLPSARGWLYKSNTNYFKYTAFWSIVCACWTISMSDEWLSHLIAPVAIVMHGLSTKKIVLSVHLDSFALKFRRQRDGEESNDEDIEGEHERGARLHLRRARRQAREAALRQHQDRIGIDDDYFDSSDDDFERERGPRLFQKWNRLKRQVKTVFDDTFMPTSWQHGVYNGLTPTMGHPLQERSLRAWESMTTHQRDACRHEHDRHDYWSGRSHEEGSRRENRSTLADPTAASATLALFPYELSSEQSHSREMRIDLILNGLLHPSPTCGKEDHTAAAGQPGMLSTLSNLRTSTRRQGLELRHRDASTCRKPSTSNLNKELDQLQLQSRSLDGISSLGYPPTTPTYPLSGSAEARKRKLSAYGQQTDEGRTFTTREQGVNHMGKPIPLKPSSPSWTSFRRLEKQMASGDPAFTSSTHAMPLRRRRRSWTETPTWRTDWALLLSYEMGRLSQEQVDRYC